MVRTLIPNETNFRDNGLPLNAHSPANKPGSKENIVHELVFDESGESFLSDEIQSQPTLVVIDLRSPQAIIEDLEGQLTIAKRQLVYSPGEHEQVRLELADLRKDLDYSERYLTDTKDELCREQTCHKETKAVLFKCQEDFRLSEARLLDIKTELDREQARHKKAVEELQCLREEFGYVSNLLGERASQLVDIISELKHSLSETKALQKDLQLLRVELTTSAPATRTRSHTHVDTNIPTPAHIPQANYPASEKAPNGFIMDNTWARSPPDSLLAPTETLIVQNKPQQAFISLDRTISQLRPSRTPSRKQEPPDLISSSQPNSRADIICIANAMLLKTCTLRIYGEHARALSLAEEVVTLCFRADLAPLVAKAQMYRGLCLMDLKRWADARWCFTRAANVRWFARNVESWGKDAERQRQLGREGIEGKDGRGSLSIGFEHIPGEPSIKLNDRQ